MTNKDILKQYVDSGIEIPDTQSAKLQGGLLTTYLRKRIIASNIIKDMDLSKHEYALINKNPKVFNNVINNIKPDNLLRYILQCNPQIGEIAYKAYTNSSAKPYILTDYIFTERNLMDINEFSKKYAKEIQVIDDKIYFKFKGELKDLAFMFDKRRGRQIVENMDDFIKTYDVDIQYHLISKKAEEEIFKKIEEIKSELSEEELEEFIESDDLEDTINDNDCLDSLKDALKDAFRIAMENAADDNKYNHVTQPILDFFEMEKFIYYTDGFLFPIKVEMASAFYLNKDFYKPRNLLEAILEWHFENGAEYLRVDEPDYGWNTYIEKNDLEDIITNKLDEI